ncbi:PEP-CTERM protein-sorting domain-containing protein [Rubritalea squalenifaciens DSM 18772]|uniref:PEP-CTERM protein-sorting domain-containing protein n=1 Tax=Rubritalea squalenifaciens DSM 18772 TaxID=1123071 RepID=A0A1M6D7V8_9BACT|nr:PEP-CTERM sorting domain-containing protein [Rubritalea squalenifaciens]SHI69316.1 PEP-CTERM protein-sorting domain-containing protein [Rubritalea squalenifaciens DSM 18772]
MKLTNLVCMLGLLALPAQAATVVFDFSRENTSTANNSQNGGDGNWAPFAEGDTVGEVSTNIGGVTMTMNGTSTTATTTTQWGINNQGIGIITDGSGGATGRRIDGQNDGESITFSFDTDVNLVSVRFGSFISIGADNDVVTITPSGQSAITLTSTDTSAPTDDISLGNVFVAAGTDITITSTSAIDGGFLFNEITIDTVSSVPEPSSTALIGLAGLGFIIRRRR